MHDRDAIAARVRELLAHVPESTVGPEFSAASAGSWTSLNHLMLISQLESEFGVVFSNQEMRELTSYGAIVTTLERRLDSVA